MSGVRFMEPLKATAYRNSRQIMFARSDHLRCSCIGEKHHMWLLAKRQVFAPHFARTF